MKIVSMESTIVNVPYKRREVSSVVARDGVTDVLVKIVTDEGIVGWGEACSGVDAGLYSARPARHDTLCAGARILGTGRPYSLKFSTTVSGSTGP